jgi:hypothetical protein
LAQCQYTAEYFDYETKQSGKFSCEEVGLESGLCIFHDENYLQDKNNFEGAQQEVIKRLMDKVGDSVVTRKHYFALDIIFEISELQEILLSLDIF